MRLLSPALWALVSVAGAAPGGTESASPFQEQPSTCSAGLLVELRVLRDPSDLAGLLSRLSAAGLQGVVLLRTDLVESLAGQLPSAVEQGHEMGLWLGQPRAPGAAEGTSRSRSSWSELRSARRSLRRSSGSLPRAVGLREITPRAEAALNELRFSLLLPQLDGADHPRRAVSLQGYQGLSLVIPPYPVPPPMDRQAADGSHLLAQLELSARALHTGERPVVRLPLAAQALDEASLALLERWSSEVLTPCGARSLDLRTAELETRRWLREQQGQQPRAKTAALGRRLERAQLQDAAAALRCPDRPGHSLPRSLPGELNLTEAFLALSLAMADPDSHTALELHALAAPRSSPRSVLPPEGVELEAAQVRRVAAELAPYLTGQVPALVSVSDHTLTAAEFLCAMSASVNDDALVSVFSTFSPDPYAEGLGWGDCSGQ